MKTTDTTREWEAVCIEDDDEATYFHYDANGNQVMVPGWWVHGPQQLGNHECGAFTEADARLMAAAPDMLAALQQVVERWRFDNDQQHTHTWHDWADCVPQIRDLIAKATGGTQ